MPWLLAALLEPALHAVTNLIDSHFSNSVFRRPGTMIFFASFTNLCFVPLLFLIDPPQMLSLGQAAPFLILGLTGTAYLYPYYKALQSDDASVVVSLFSLGKVFVPLLAFFALGERLSPSQYLGFLVLVISGALLTLNGSPKGGWRPNASFWWMMLCALILAVEAVAYKFVFLSLGWGTGFAWGTAFSFLFALPLLLPKAVRQDIRAHWPAFRKSFPLFALEEFLTFAGSGASTFAISLASVTLVSAISASQPLFVLLFALLLSRFLPGAFREDLSLQALARKIPLFGAMVAGILLIA